MVESDNQSRVFRLGIILIFFLAFFAVATIHVHNTHRMYAASPSSSTANTVALDKQADRQTDTLWTVKSVCVYAIDVVSPS